MAEDEEAIQKRKEEQEERLIQIRVMMDKEKKVREVTVTGGGSELTVQAETNKGAESGKGEDGKESEKKGKPAKKGAKAGKK